MSYNIIDDAVWYKYNEYTSKYYKCLTTYDVSRFEFNNDYLAPLRLDYDWQVHIDDSVPDRIVAEVYLKKKITIAAHSVTLIDAQIERKNNERLRLHVH